MSATDAATEYALRRDDRSARAAALDRRHARLAWARLLVVLFGAWLALAAWRGAVPWAALVVPVLFFTALAVAHDRTLRAKSRAERAARFYDDGLALVEDRWAGRGRGGEAFLDEHHVFAADLDLFGAGSTFERIDRTRTTAGAKTLAAWLTVPSPPPLVRERQAAVAETKTRLDLREDLALLGDDLRGELDAEQLRAWGELPPRTVSSAHRVAAVLLSAGTIAALAGWGAGSIGPAAFVVAAALQGAHALVLRGRVSAIVAAADRPERDLELLAGLLGRIEREPFASPFLAGLRARLDTDGVAPSAAIRRLALLTDLLDARRNQLFVPVALLTRWTMHSAAAIEAWRIAHGPAIARWLASVGEIEALLSIAAYAYERPGDCVPEIVEDGPVFDAGSLGHPLIPDARCVRNDVRLDRSRPLLLVSGSNMSGKSTLLRSIGTATCLAQAGAPVDASRLTISPLAVGATLRIQDSLREGSSRFFAEIVRLRAIVDLASGPRPVLFLLDEVLAGTNSHDRAIGAEAILKGLVARGAIGLATTHDLALTRLADALAPRASNVHFEDHMEDGRLVFDYVMRPGVVTRSNALDLMRSVGLEI